MEFCVQFPFAMLEFCLLWICAGLNIKNKQRTQKLNTKETNDPILKRDIEVNKEFLKDETQVAEKHTF